MGSVKPALTHFFPGISTPHHQHNHWDAVLLRARERPCCRAVLVRTFSGQFSMNPLDPNSFMRRRHLRQRKGSAAASISWLGFWGAPRRECGSARALFCGGISLCRLVIWCARYDAARAHLFAG